MGCGVRYRTIVESILAGSEDIGKAIGARRSGELLADALDVLSDGPIYFDLCKLQSEQGEGCEEMFEILTNALAKHEDNDDMRMTLMAFDEVKDDMVKRCLETQA